MVASKFKLKIKFRQVYEEDKSVYEWSGCVSEEKENVWWEKRRPWTKFGGNRLKHETKFN